jgi:CheY-like chemotaxis protein
MLAYSGKAVFEWRPVDPAAVVRDNVHMLRTVVGANATFRLRLDPNTPRVRSDTGQMQQVIMNLITNAAEALGDEPGLVMLETAVRDCAAADLAESLLEEKPAPGRFVSVVVEDTGCGMDAETVQRMFDPFFTTKFTGRGLGMSAVLGIVRAHDGAVFVRSEPGAGTRMEVLFPALPEAPAATAVPQPGDAGGSVAPAALHGTALVVDDETVVRMLCQRVLERAGLRVLVAADGYEALALFRENRDAIDCAVLDLTMPVMDGVALFRELRQERPDLPVLLASGYTEQDAIARFGDDQPDGFLHKPYQAAALRAEIRRVLGQ